MHLVTLAADFQQHDFRQFSAVYNPDDLRECGGVCVCVCVCWGGRDQVR